jgi:hypothetical protein
MHNWAARFKTFCVKAVTKWLPKTVAAYFIILGVCVVTTIIFHFGIEQPILRLLALKSTLRMQLAI